MKKLKFHIAIFMTTTIHLAFSQSGALDPTFGNNGIVITDFNNGSVDGLYALEVQPDQKILAMGYKGSGINSWLVCRYNTDGTLDTGFGVNGFFNVVLPEIVVCWASALQADGKIIMAGTTSHFIDTLKSEDEDFILIRLNQDGKLDSTFGASGIVVKDIGGLIERAYEVLIQSDGKILVTGNGWNDQIVGPLNGIVRFETNGQLDTTFGNQGIKVLYEPFIVHTMVLQPNGKILIGGTNLGPLGDFEIRRFESDGTVDNTFGDGGKVHTNLSGQSDYLDGISVEPDGRIFVSGGANLTGSTTDLAFARYNIDGSLDASYGNNGFEIIPLTPKSQLTDIAKQPDGKYILCGSSNHLDGVTHFFLVRINHNGGLDESFGDHGVVITDLHRDDESARSLVIQSNNNIVVGGTSYSPESKEDFTLARYIVDDVVSTKDQNIEAVSLVASPNPCREFFAIDVGKLFDEFHCTISDISGSVKMDKTVRADAQGRLIIDSSFFSSGYYSVLLENKSMRSTVSIVVQN